MKPEGVYITVSEYPAGGVLSVPLYRIARVAGDNSETVIEVTEAEAQNLIIDLTVEIAKHRHLKHCWCPVENGFDKPDHGRCLVCDGLIG